MEKSLDYIVSSAIEFGLEIHIVQTIHSVIGIPVFCAYCENNGVLAFSHPLWCSSSALVCAIRILGYKKPISLDWVLEDEKKIV